MKQQVYLVLCWVNEVFGKKIHRQTTMELLTGNVMRDDVFHCVTQRSRIEAATFSNFRCTKNHRENVAHSFWILLSPQSLFLLKFFFFLSVSFIHKLNYRGELMKLRSTSTFRLTPTSWQKEKTPNKESCYNKEIYFCK